MTTFKELNLNTPLLNALDDSGYIHPTTIQEKAFPVAMSGRDVVGIAQTGTGKTVAFLLPCLRQWKFTKEKHPQILILVPTRELVLQVVEEAKKLAAYMNIRVAGVYGGVNMSKQVLLVKDGVDLLVATPGRLLDLTLNGVIRLKSVKRLVIDEVDEIMDLGFRPQLVRIFDLLPVKRQNLLFSATLTEEVETLMHDFFDTPERIEAAPMGTPLEKIVQSAYQLPNFNSKINMLKLMLSHSKQYKRVLVFALTKKLADNIYERVADVFPDEIGVIHSNKAQNNRFETVRRFQEGSYRVLIATDLIARGLDIADVSHVINFDMPDEPELYIHRIGRTGRADKEGTAVSLVSPVEEERQLAVEELMQYQIPMHELPEELELSDVLTPDELEKKITKNIRLKLTNPLKGGGAFHEKIDKNKKVNQKVRHAELMRIKYGKPKKRKPKK
ncbi:DEAD/DEAH box helicase [Paludibacter sp.]|uniref:DEAD/DEAH box helicase n=1 Tax=Paludibacter sp. TaxID=1898105 RepID=UPI0013553E18|nr:DEAD/DEAH box helicase [Paludibacter sp.]MTK52955.1 DEAD/DEAH box helicase [Paludibacter sp.]